MADLDKLSGAELGSTNHGYEYILRVKIQDGGRTAEMRKLPFQKDAFFAES